MSDHIPSVNSNRPTRGYPDPAGGQGSRGSSGASRQEEQAATSLHVSVLDRMPVFFRDWAPLPRARADRRRTALLVARHGQGRAGPAREPHGPTAPISPLGGANVNDHSFARACPLAAVLRARSSPRSRRASSTEWQAVPCVAAPLSPQPPRHGPPPSVVGGGNDVSAQAPSGFISQAIGTFENITNVTSESDPGQATPHVPTGRGRLR